jgi:predicted small secreted protein
LIEQAACAACNGQGMKAMLKKIIFALAAGSIALSASACNTVKGAGEDIKSASESTEEAIND